MGVHPPGRSGPFITHRDHLPVRVNRAEVLRPVRESAFPARPEAHGGGVVTVRFHPERGGNVHAGTLGARETCCPRIDPGKKPFRRKERFADRSSCAGPIWQSYAVLDTQTEIHRVAEDRYETVLDAGWSIGTSLNGGYTQLPVVRAVLSAEGHPHPVAVTTDFLTAAKPGHAEIIVERLRTGKTIGTSRATLIQDGEAVLVSSVVTTTLDDAPPDVDVAPVVDLPSPDQCAPIRSDTLRDSHLGLMDHVDIRLAPESATLIRSRPDGSFALRGWARMADGSDPDPLVCLLVVDAFPPVTFTLGRYGWAPTVQLTTYLRALPAPGWLKAELRGKVLSGGWFDEDCTLRDSKGRLVAQARQIARVPRVLPRAR
jgi:hypothetical protein